MIIFTKYSNERRCDLRIRTDILKQEDGTRYICKSAASKEAEKHVKGIYDRFLWLQKDLEGTYLTVNQCSICEEGVRFPFLEGRTLEEKLDELLSKKNVSKLADTIEEYLAMFGGDGSGKRDGMQEFSATEEFRLIFGEVSFSQKQYCRNVSNIDMIFSNAIETNTGYELIDYEWTFDFPIPVKYIVYRCLYYYVMGNTKRDSLIEEDLYQRFGISNEEKEQFSAMEKKFQEYILGTYTPVWKQYDDISEGVLELSSMMEKASRQKLLRRAEVYFDDGRGFGTWNWKKYGVSETGSAAFEIAIPKGTRQVRLDPCSCQSVVRIEELSQNGKKLVYSANGFVAPNGDLIFDTEDPQIIFAVEGTSGVRVAFHSESISGLGREVLLNQQGRIRWMEQTKVWKLYERIKEKGRK